MSDQRRGPRSWLDSLLGVCLTVLAAALALHFAMGLLQRDWPWIVGTFTVTALVWAGASWLRRDRW